MPMIRFHPATPGYEVLRSIARPSIRCHRRFTSSDARAASLKLDLTQSHPLIRRIDSVGSSSSVEKIKAEDFVYYPDFFTPKEQAVLVRLAMWKLDRVDTKKKRTGRRRRSVAESSGPSIGTEKDTDLQSLFEDPTVYGFEEGHFDSVITDYRESLLTAFPEPSLVSLTTSYPPILSRVYSLLPASPGSDLARGLYERLVLPDQLGDQGQGPDPSLNPWDSFAAPLQTTTHALHLSPTGRIDPHVDNVDASGSVIIGVSLGAERVLRLERRVNEGEEDGRRGRKDGWEVLLKSGSVYVQKDTIRYSYAHSILPYSDPASKGASGEGLKSGHRISLMIRDAKPDFSAAAVGAAPEAGSG